MKEHVMDIIGALGCAVIPPCTNPEFVWSKLSLMHVILDVTDIVEFSVRISAISLLELLMSLQYDSQVHMGNGGEAALG